VDDDLRLLLDETQVLWGTDSWGRYGEPPLCLAAISAAGHRVTVWPDLARSLRARLRHVLEQAAQERPAPGLRDALQPAVPLLHAAGIAAAVHGGPSFLVPPLLVKPPLAAAAGVRILRSDRPDDVSRLASGRRPPSWDEPEWAALLGGQLGPWAMLGVCGQVVSICHTPRDSPMGAEAGTWTDPAFRGNGYACASTAAWASVMGQRDGRPLFYSTADDNLSSRRVAARLGLASLGWIWSLRAAG
jgi:RimJ/RimL family protein N-acetyltransferase